MDRLKSLEVFEALRKEDRRMLMALYQRFYPPVRIFILSRNGNEFDAQDIFQDALVIIFMKIRHVVPDVKSSFGTYFFSICKYLWFKELNRKNRSHADFQNLDEMIDLDNNFYRDYIRMEKRKLVMDHFNEMQEDCQRILKMFVNDTPLDKICKIMGYSSEQYARNRRSSCKERLIRRIWNSPRYKELKNEAYREDSKVPRW